MVLNAGSLSRRIQVQREIQVTGPGGVVSTEWEDFGPTLFARRRDMSDAERVVAAHWENRLVSRFVIRDSAFARSIRRADRLMHEGMAYEIDGIKELPFDRAFLEITAWTEDTL
ncbi:head-tail adaptor protein [Thioclava sediminum]|uniref:head-tail adaptor protein n=1 Tax=Thioclava sediminum TaxID=1915319 RepID=UPI0009986268|nr:head-tail adaptor protein [Thioclava sediminum]